MVDSVRFDLWSFAEFAVIPAAIWFCLRHVDKVRQLWLRTLAKLAGWFLVATSSLLLILSLPSGSVDVSDLWGFCLYALLPAVPLALIAVAMWGVIRAAWVRVALGSLSTIALICGSMIFVVLCCAQASCERRPPSLHSQNNLHVALRDFRSQGGLGDDYATVRIRREWWPIAQTAYDGLGKWDRKADRLTSPEVEWVDSGHLRIRYFDDRIPGDGRPGPAVCNSVAAGVQILCENTAQASAR